MNSNRLVIAQLNIKSLRNKFTSLSTMIKDNVQFHVDGYTIFRRDRNENGDGLLLFIRDNVPSTLLKTDPNFEAFYVELNIREKQYYYVAHINQIKTLLINILTTSIET